MSTPTPKTFPVHIADPPAAGFSPFRVWAAAAAIAALGGAAVVYPAAGAVGLFAAIVLWAVVRVVLRPFWAVALTFCFFPVFVLLRALHTAYHLPVFASGVRTFPEIMIALAGVGVLLRAARNKEDLPRILQDDIPSLLWIMGGVYAFAVALIDHVPPFGPLNGWWVSITPAVFYFVVRWGRPGAAGIRALVRLFIVTYALLAAGSFYDYVFRPLFVVRLSNAERAFFVPSNLTPEVFWRVYPRMQSLLFEENAWGTLCAFVFLGCLPHLRGWRTPFWLVLLTLVSVIGAALSMSRGTFVCIVVGMGILLALRGRHRRYVLGIMGGVVGLGMAAQVLFAAQSFAVSALFYRLSTISLGAAQKGEVANDRTAQWVAGWHIFLQQPSGKGLGTLGYATHLSGIGFFTIADGIYFRILGEQGAPGFLLSLFSLVGAAWVIWRHLPSCAPTTRRFGVSLLAFHCGLMVQSIGANTYDFLYIPPLLWTALGLFVTRCEWDEAEKKQTLPISFDAKPSEIAGR